MKCVHFWRISDDGSEGTCRKCGQRRTFPTLSRMSVDQWFASIKKAREEVQRANIARAMANRMNETEGSR